MAVFLTIKVVPRSGRQCCIIDEKGVIKCFLKNPPEDGKANKELISLLSSLFKVPKHAIEIIKGHTTRTKMVHITTSLNKDQLLKCLTDEVQNAIF
ncbi:MAG: DUF167 domain-containing protein [Candidatus Babeliaceae bacterium]